MMSGQDAVAERFGAGPVLRENTPSPQSRRHIQLRQQLLNAHPEAAALARPDHRGVYGALVILALHWTVCWWVAGTNILTVFLMAFLVGQVMIHSAGALLHETAHRLVFRGRRSKLAFDLLLETILISFSLQLSYQHEHVSLHHPFLGNYERDYEHEDNCRYQARRRFRAAHPVLEKLMVLGQIVVALLPLGFLVSDRIFLPIYRRATGRAVKDPERRMASTHPTTGERALFMVVSAAVLVFLWLAFGWLAVLYQVWSLSIFRGKAGVTNLGQSLAEHPGDDGENPTRSQYGWLNWILFNTGYHHEHHTYPQVPWTRLPRLKALAPEVFNQQEPRSYFRCWWDHVRADFSPSRRNELQDRPELPRCAG
jgi:sphingolipid delta-4 desaturase